MKSINEKAEKAIALVLSSSRTPAVYWWYEECWEVKKRMFNRFNRCPNYTNLIRHEHKKDE